MALREVKNTNNDIYINSLDFFKELILSLVERGESKTFYKFSDGEYYFLKGKKVGSTSKGRRDTNTDLDLNPFRADVLKNDYFCCYDIKRDRDWFIEYFGKSHDFSVDYINILTASNWFTNQGLKVGLVGAAEKLDLIKELCNHKEYVDYIGEPFNDYIKVNQRYLCDNIPEAEESLLNQLKNSDSDIYLVGIGHSQTALLHKMKEFKRGVYIVIGSGIDAYAGVQDNDRPYMANWINYQLKNYDYNKIDIWRKNFKLVKKI